MNDPTTTLYFPQDRRSVPEPPWDVRHADSGDYRNYLEGIHLVGCNEAWTKTGMERVIDILAETAQAICRIIADEKAAVQAAAVEGTLVAEPEGDHADSNEDGA